MDATDTPDTGSRQPAADGSGALVQKARHRLRNFGAAIASIAAVGAVIGGLTGYWNAWKAVKTELLPQTPTTRSTTVVVSRGPTVAVLPVANGTSDPKRDQIADQLTDDLISELAKFKALRVLPRGETTRLKTKESTMSDIRAATGADYIVEGALREGGEQRIRMQLTDARTGQQVWSKVIDQPPANEQTKVLPSVAGLAASYVGAITGAISHAEYKNVRDKPVEQLSPYHCIVLSLSNGGASQWDASLVVHARQCAERLLKREPNNALGWAALATVYLNQRWWGLGLESSEAADIEKRAYLLDKAREAASKAVELDPSDPFAHSRLATAYVAACRLDEGTVEVQRSLELNPNDPSILAFLGNWLTYSGDLDRGVRMVENAMAISGPGFAGWWWDAALARAFARGQYDDAVAAARKANVDQFWNAHVSLAYTLEAAGKHDEARREAATVLKLRPSFTIREADAFYRMWCFKPDYIEKMNGLLRQVGLPE